MAARATARREQARDYRQPQPPLRRRGEVCVAEGFALSVTVERGRLVVRDGAGRDRRERLYDRVRCRLARLVVLGSAGSMSLATVRWLADLGIPLLHLDRDGRLLACSASGREDARLRRAQAYALTNEAGIAITRRLLAAKVAGQEALLERLAASDAQIASFQKARAALDRASTLNDLLMAERDAAFAYWSAWGPVEVRFGKRDLDRVPEHWLRFGRRSAPGTSGPRSAVNPGNSSLNYLYRLLEGETRIACLACGLDPAVGILHADVRGRDSFVLDLMEPIRPAVDGYLLDLLQQRTLRAADFYQTRKGVCRVLSPFSHTLAETTTSWARLIAPVAEEVAAMLASAPGSRIDRLTTPLTNANRQAGRAAMRRTARTARPRAPKPPRTCQRCGGELPHRDRRVCDACLAETQAEQFDTFRGTGLAALERLKLEGRDPTHGGPAARKRGQAIADRKREIAEWEARYGQLVELTAFKREILPLIQEVPLSRLARATGLSLRYVSQIRRGERVPHPKHWSSFRNLPS
jgi:CRISPR-associated endonuclease Cas1